MSQTITSTVDATIPSTMMETPPPDISNQDRVAYLFGYPIAHSLSPLFHGTIFRSLNLNYLQFLYETQTLKDCIELTKNPKFLGASVTMPFKVAIIPYLDQLTPEGAAIGAINTIYHRTSPTGEKILCGTNTDCIGVREAILQNASASTISRIKGSAGMVIGGGGTCRAAVYALKKFLGCETVYMVNRDKSECDAVIAECSSNGFGDNLLYIESVEQAKALAAPTVIISAIPDFTPISDDEHRARGIITEFLGKEGEKGVILEMCYHPSPDTQIAALSAKAGWQVVGGVEAMINQGLEQDKVWLGVELEQLPVKEVRTVVLAKLANDRAKHASS
ncbi:quinate dehydrogenase [Botrytis cinerea]